MDVVDRDDIAHAINQTFAFFGKELDQLQLRFWLRAMAPHDVNAIKRALADYTGIGRYAPKPRDVIDLIGEHSEKQRREAPAITPPQTKEAPAHVAKAWAYVIKFWGVGDLYRSGDVSEDQERAYLVTCNTQAKANNNPESIPPDAWMEGVWGCTRERAMESMT